MNLLKRSAYRPLTSTAILTGGLPVDLVDEHLQAILDAGGGAAREAHVVPVGGVAVAALDVLRHVPADQLDAVRRRVRAHRPAADYGKENAIQHYYFSCNSRNL